MDLLNNFILKEDDNIDLLLSLISIDEEKIEAKHHNLDDELKKIITIDKDYLDKDNNIQFYMSQLYRTLYALYYENVDLKKKIDTLTVSNELLKSYIDQNTKIVDDETAFSK